MIRTDLASNRNMNRSDIKKKVGVKQQFSSNITRTSSHGISFSSRVSRPGAGSRSNVMASGSKWNVAGDSKAEKTASHGKPVVQVLDDMGNDVTPRSLLTIDANAVKRMTSNSLFGSDSIVTPSELGQSIYAASNASFLGGFSRSVMGSTGASGWSSPESISEALAEPGSRHHDISTGLGDIQRKYVPVKEELTSSDLDKMVDITLEETETIWLLDIPGVSVCQESEIAQSVVDSNLRYTEILKTRAGNDSFVERGMQTFNDDPKNKEIQTTAVEQNDVGCMATTWDMHDVYKEASEAESSDVQDAGAGTMESLSRPNSGQRTSANSEENESVASQALRSGSAMSESVLSASHASFATKMSEDETAPKEEKKEAENGNDEVINDVNHPVLKSEALRKDLFTMERVLSLNSFQPRQAKYRGLKEVPDIDRKDENDQSSTSSLDVTELGPNLEKLWSYSCAVTKGRNVSCLAWNKRNPDILAVGYGEFEFSNQKGGIACCWSLKNPEYPERVYHVQSGVMSLDFSELTPNLLAFGLYDGTIVIYNVRNVANSPVLDSLESDGKHTAPVWRVKWISRDQNSGDEKDEILVSVAADGRVTKWTIRKGFECADLMKLKRVNIQRQKSKKSSTNNSKKSDALISRFAAGFCFDFHPTDSNIYIVGTEEGHIHKCSCSYNEQYLESYDGHTGPVYDIKWSPFLQDAFLSSSADWSVKLWHHERATPILTFSSSTKCVNSIFWSPFSSTVFGCVNEGAIEVWDLAQNTLDPLIVHSPVQDLKLSTISFSVNSDTVLAGDSDGQVNVYLLSGMKKPGKDEKDALASVILPSVAKDTSARG